MRRRAFILWCIAQMLAAVVAFLAFFKFAPWLATESISEAPPQALATLPKDCPAFSVNHGDYICEWHDTIARNPWGFTLCAVILASCVGFLYFTGFTGRGWRIPYHKNWWRYERRSSDDGG
jgi:hypothetical protein